MITKGKSAFYIAGMIISWSVYYAISKVIVNATGSAFLASFILRSVTFVFLALQMIFMKKQGLIFSCGKAVWFLILIGILGFSQDVFNNLGYSGGNLSTGTALLKTDVIMANIVTVTLYKKKLFKSDWAGSVLMIAGVLLVLGISFSDMSFQATDLFFILSAAALTANAFVVKAAQSGHSVDADVISCYNNFIVMSFSLAGAAALGDVNSSVLSKVIPLWPLVILGGLAQTGIFFFYYRNLQSHEVWIVKLYLLLIPICSLFIGVFFLNEAITVKKIVGILVILAGAVLILLRDKINPEGESADGQTR